MNRGGNKLLILVTLGLLLLTASGCGVRVRMDYWVGRSAAQLRRDEGRPKVVMAFPDGSRALRYWGKQTEDEVESRTDMPVLCVAGSGDLWEEVVGCLWEWEGSAEYDHWRAGPAYSGSDYTIEDNRTFYVDAGGLVVGWLYREKDFGKPTAYKYGPKNAAGYEAVRHYLELERQWLAQQGKKPGDDRAVRGKLRPDIFDQETRPLEENAPKPILDLFTEGIPGGAYSVGRGVERVFEPSTGDENP